MTRPNGAAPSPANVFLLRDRTHPTFTLDHRSNQLKRNPSNARSRSCQTWKCLVVDLNAVTHLSTRLLPSVVQTRPLPSYPSSDYDVRRFVLLTRKVRIESWEDLQTVIQALAFRVALQCRSRGDCYLREFRVFALYKQSVFSRSDNAAR